MKQKRAIANIKNPIGRRLMLALVSPIALLILLITVVYSIFAGIWHGIKSAWEEFTYHIVKIFTIIAGGYTLAWLGREEFNKREDARIQAIIDRKFARVGGADWEATK